MARSPRVPVPLKHLAPASLGIKGRGRTGHRCSCPKPARPATTVTLTFAEGESHRRIMPLAQNWGGGRKSRWPLPPPQGRPALGEDSCSGRAGGHADGQGISPSANRLHAGGRPRLGRAWRRTVGGRPGGEPAEARPSIAGMDGE